MTPMIALLQRVVEASVCIKQKTTARIGRGLLAFIGMRPKDDEVCAARLLDRILKYRVFADSTGKMNLSLLDVAGDLLLVPQFTLAADTTRGLRPGFSAAAPPQQARSLYDSLLVKARTRIPGVQTGEFGADMQIHLINDGPVTIWLEADS